MPGLPAPAMRALRREVQGNLDTEPESKEPSASLQEVHEEACTEEGVKRTSRDRGESDSHDESTTSPALFTSQFPRRGEIGEHLRA